MWFSFDLNQGFNVTISAPVATPRRRVDQIREVNLGLHPGMKDSLTKLCADPNTTLLILSGSTKGALDKVLSLLLHEHLEVFACS